VAVLKSAPCLPGRRFGRSVPVLWDEGLARSRRARWKRAEAPAEQKRVRDLLAQSRELLKQMQAD
jgi:hypothetical protein